MGQSPGHDIVERAHARKQRNILKRPGNPLLGNLMRLHRPALGAMKPDLTLLRMIKPVDHIQHRRFPSPVRPNNRPDFPLANVKGNILDRHHTTKPQRDVLHLHYLPTNGAPIRGLIRFRLIQHYLQSPFFLRAETPRGHGGRAPILLTLRDGGRGDVRQHERPIIPPQPCQTRSQTLSHPAFPASH